MQYYPNPPQQQIYPGAQYQAPGYSVPVGQQIVPVGYGGYYTNNYNYFNPYFIKQQQEQQYQVQKQKELEQIEFMKRCYRNSCAYQGREATPEELRYYDSLSVYGNNQYVDPRVAQLNQQEYAEYASIYQHEQAVRANQNKATQLAVVGQECIDPYKYNAMSHIAKVYEKERSEVPEDIGLVEYLEKHAGRKYVSARMRQQRNTNNTGSLYNKNEYNDLINQHKSSLFGGVFNPNANLDDQEIRLPNFISEQTRQERRKRFMETILSQGGV